MQISKASICDNTVTEVGSCVLTSLLRTVHGWLAVLPLLCANGNRRHAVSLTLHAVLKVRLVTHTRVISKDVTSLRLWSVHMNVTVSRTENQATVSDMEFPFRGQVDWQGAQRATASTSGRENTGLVHRPMCN